MAYTLPCWGGGLLCFPAWTASVSVGLSRHQRTRRQTGARAAGPAPPLCGVPTPPPYKQAVQWLCSVPSSGCTEAPGSLRGGSVCCPAGCNNGGWLLACRGRRRRRSSACTERSGSVSGSRPALGPRTRSGCLWSRTASGWRWCDIFQSSLCGHGETWSAAEQQRRRLDSHRQRSDGWGCVQAAGCTPEENRTAAFTLTHTKSAAGSPYLPPVWKLKTHCICSFPHSHSHSTRESLTPSKSSMCASWRGGFQSTPNVPDKTERSAVRRLSQHTHGHSQRK